MLAAARQRSRGEEDDRAFHWLRDDLRKNPGLEMAGTPTIGRNDVRLLDRTADDAKIRERISGEGNRRRDRQTRQGARREECEDWIDWTVELLKQSHEPEGGKPDKHGPVLRSSDGEFRRAWSDE